MKREWSVGEEKRLLAIVIGLAVSVFAVCVCLTSIAFYPGGPLCFAAPKRCPANTRPVRAEVVAVTGTAYPPEGPTATLIPTPTQWRTPTPEETPTLLESPVQYVSFRPSEETEVDCGRNPYKFNGMERRWERTFSAWCYPQSKDPFDVVFGGDDAHLGLTYGEVAETLDLLNLEHTSHAGQVRGLSEMGIWDEACECSSGLASINSVIYSQSMSTPTPQPGDKEAGEE